MESVEARDISLTLIGESSDRRLQLVSGHSIDWPGITLRPAESVWDGSRYQHLSVDLTNTGGTGFEIGLRIDNPGGDGQKNSVTVMAHISPGESRTLTGTLYTTPWKFSEPLRLEGMHAAPGQQTIDPAQISQVIIFLRQPVTDHKFTIDNVRFQTPMTEMDPEAFLPFIDEFGQFIPAGWPGKVESVADLIAHRNSERKDLAEHPGPTGFDRFGGWKNGPRLEASRFFRVQRYDGRWWLVDPDGSLFWSHGLDAISVDFGGTGTEHRENYFRQLPAKDEELGQFYYSSDWAFGFYASRTPYRSFNFQAANLYRKYGENWHAEFADLAHQRLRSWAMNTMACWSDPRVYAQQRTPYTAFFRVEKCPTLEGAERRWTKFVDVFDPQFPLAIKHGITTCQSAAGDPWCLGFFVDNELYWGDDHALALWSLRSPAQQPAKQVLIEDLKGKYETITRLNAAWGTAYETWQGFADATESPDEQKAGSDLKAFSRKFAETYFGTIKEELAAAAPGQLYLGCRFIWENEIAIRAACQYCDVVSFNRYLYSVENLHLPTGEDKPVMIGEFHFGALDRGMFHPSKVPARDQQHRAECYRDFVNSALRNPLIVGTHWFQYTSEPTSGRGDGENYQIGFVDICDTPYEETIAAARKVGHGMYELRAGRLGEQQTGATND